jgi:hypothetical protein
VFSFATPIINAVTNVRIASPEGDYWIALTLPEDATERARWMTLVSDFMVLKSSPAFVLATEIKEPDAILVIGTTHAGRFVVFSRIERKPLKFAPEEWLDETAAGKEMWDLLQRGVRSLSKERVAEVEAFFADNGEFPAVKIDKRFVRAPRLRPKLRVVIELCCDRRLGREHWP